MTPPTMTTKSELPDFLKASGSCLQDSKGEIVAIVQYPRHKDPTDGYDSTKAEPLAAALVHRYNRHDELVEALQGAVDQLIMSGDKPTITRQLRAVLAKAGQSV